MTWFTLNCKYNTAYDIHRLNVAAQFARPAVESLEDEHRQVRFDFSRDAPDIVTYMVSLRAELQMRMVMPAIVPHTETQPLLPMARFEMAAHPHHHGFCVGAGNPRLERVRADVDDDGDGDVASGSDVGSAGVRSGNDGAVSADGGAEGEAVARSSREAVSEDDAREGLEGAGSEVRRTARGGRGGRRKSQGRRQLAAQTTMRRLPDTLHPRNAGVQSQAAMEDEFWNYFGELVSEWNPCYSADGKARYTWDEEIGAHDVEVCLPCGGDSAGGTRGLPQVDVMNPERTRLRVLLDAVLRDEQEGKPIDLQPVRRLVAALVQTSGRHTWHGTGRPVLGKHACARGKAGCLGNRYSFPHKKLDRDAKLKCDSRSERVKDRGSHAFLGTTFTGQSQLSLSSMQAISVKQLICGSIWVVACHLVKT